MMTREKAAQIRLQVKTRWRYLRREVLNLSQAHAARLCGVSRGTVVRWESPESEMLPDIGSMIVLCTAMRYEPSRLVEWIAGGRNGP